MGGKKRKAHEWGLNIFSDLGVIASTSLLLYFNLKLQLKTQLLNCLLKVVPILFCILLIESCSK